MRWPIGREVEALEEFAALVKALPARALTRKDVLDPRFAVYEDERLSIYYAPFGFADESARVALVGVTPGPTQMLQAFETARARLHAGDAPQDVWRQVQARAGFKGMRTVLSRWLDDLELNVHLELGSCAELFQARETDGLHMTSALRYPTFKRRADNTLTNYDGRAPEVINHHILRSIVTDVLALELGRLAEAVIVPVGKANDVIAWLCASGTIERNRCIIGLPHPSPASPYRERYFQQVKAALQLETRRLAPRTSRNTAADGTRWSRSGGGRPAKQRRRRTKPSSELWSACPETGTTDSPQSINEIVARIDDRLIALKRERAALERARAVLVGEPGAL